MPHKNAPHLPASSGSGQSAHRSLRNSIRLMGISYVFMMTWYFIISGLPLTLLANILDMNEFGFGLLGGLMMYGHIAQIIGSYVIERYDRRKLIVILAGVIHRSVWMIIAALPLFVGSGTWTWKVLLTLAGFSYIGASFVYPGGVSWIADLVPGRLQGRFFGRRMRFGFIASISALIIIGYILDKAEACGPTVLKTWLIAIFIFGSIIGTFEYILYMFVYDPPRKKTASKVRLWKILWKPLSDKEYLCYLGVYCTLTSSTAFMGLFVFLFLLDVLNMSNLQVTFFLVLTPNLINAVFYPFWGKITDQTGYKPALVIGTLGYFFNACWFIMATSDNWILPYIFGMIAFCFTSALDTGTAVLMYTKISGPNKREWGSSYPAVAGVISSISGGISAFFAGALALWVGKDWHGSFINHPLSYHSIIFIAAILIRLTAFAWLLGIKNLKQYSATDTIRLIFHKAKNTIFLKIPLRVRSRREKKK